jgi:Bifunctional DNA primase/polymerase, N-terminal
MHRAALAYVMRFGWRVLPTLPRRKEPHGRFVRRGFLDATMDPEQVRRWWTADAHAGVAIACAPSGLVVLDVDPRNGGDETFGRLQRELGKLPVTPTCLTGAGGMHLYFRDTVGAYIGSAGDGVDIKSEGYVLAPPSLHPNGASYVWDVAARPLETPVADLPDAWLRHLTTTPQARGALLPSSGVDAADSWLGHAFAAMGWLGDVLLDGKRMVRCPWLHEHSDGRGAGNDSSTVLFPRAEGHTLGGFRCAHAHCEGRGWHEVVEVFPADARWKADQATRKEGNRIALEQIAKLREAVRS